MPTIFSHAFFGTTIGSSFAPKELRVRFLVLTALCTILPDFDVISFKFGIDYASVLGHRGITHSIAFAFVIGCLVGTLFFQKTGMPTWKLVLYFSAATLSHPLLDMFTNGGLGVALLAPFSNERFFSPWRPIQVSPIGAGFFSERGIAVVLSELFWIWLPSAAIASVLWVVLKRRNQPADSPSLSGRSEEES